jgi:hypothetical protein
MHIIYPFSHRKNLAEHWDLPNTGIFYSKDVASAKGGTFVLAPVSKAQKITYLLMFGGVV